MKLNFLLRLYSNLYTHDILKESIEVLKAESYLMEVRGIISLNEDVITLELLCSYAKQQLSDLKVLKRENKYLNNNSNVNLIRKAIRSHNKAAIPEELFKLTKFE